MRNEYKREMEETQRERVKNERGKEEEEKEKKWIRMTDVQLSLSRSHPVAEEGMLREG